MSGRIGQGFDYYAIYFVSIAKLLYVANWIINQNLLKSFIFSGQMFIQHLLCVKLFYAVRIYQFRTKEKQTKIFGLMELTAHWRETRNEYGYISLSLIGINVDVGKQYR